MSVERQRGVGGHWLWGLTFAARPSMLEVDSEELPVQHLYTEVAENVFRITLPHPCLFATNVYLVRGKSPFLIDSGHYSSASTERLEQALRALELRLGNIRYYFLTDIGPDRVGGLLAAQSRTSRRVVADGRARETARDYADFSREYCAGLLRPVWEDRNLTARFDRGVLDRLCHQAFRTGGELPVNVPVTKSTVYRVGDRRIRAIPMPGTSGTHVVYWMPEEKILFSGDLGALGASELPLLHAAAGGSYAGFRESLAAAWQWNPQLTLPARGSVGAGGEFILRRLAHMASQERDNLRALLLAGPRSLATLLELMTLGRGLSPARILEKVATLKTLLDDLVQAEEVEVLYEDGCWIYRLGWKSLHARASA